VHSQLARHRRVGHVGPRISTLDRSRRRSLALAIENANGAVRIDRVRGIGALHIKAWQLQMTRWGNHDRILYSEAVLAKNYQHIQQPTILYPQ
jgi:hypothetical protein